MTMPGKIARRATPMGQTESVRWIAAGWWERVLYNQSAKRLRSALLGRPRTVVVNVPYRRDDPDLHGGKVPDRP